MNPEVQIKLFRSPLKLKTRLKKLIELSEAKSFRIDTIDFRFEGPEYGWLDVDVINNGQVVYSFSMSDVYEPFEQINDWLFSTSVF